MWAHQRIPSKLCFPSWSQSVLQQTISISFLWFSIANFVLVDFLWGVSWFLQQGRSVSSLWVLFNWICCLLCRLCLFGSSFLWRFHRYFIWVTVPSLGMPVRQMKSIVNRVRAFIKMVAGIRVFFCLFVFVSLWRVTRDGRFKGSFPTHGYKSMWFNMDMGLHKSVVFLFFFIDTSTMQVCPSYCSIFSCMQRWRLKWWSKSWLFWLEIEVFWVGERWLELDCFSIQIFTAFGRSLIILTIEIGWALGYPSVLFSGLMY